MILIIQYLQGSVVQWSAEQMFLGPLVVFPSH